MWYKVRYMEIIFGDKKENIPLFIFDSCIKNYKVIYIKDNDGDVENVINSIKKESGLNVERKHLEFYETLKTATNEERGGYYDPTRKMHCERRSNNTKKGFIPFNNYINGMTKKDNFKIIS